VLRTLRPSRRLTQKLSHQGKKKPSGKELRAFFGDGVFIVP
jgi:hypothetical protein